MHAVVMNTTYFNHTGYGPLPFWDDLTNYTAFNNRDFVHQDDEKPVPAAPLGFATGAFFIFACGLKKPAIKIEWVIWTVVMLCALVLIFPIICTLLLYKLVAHLCLHGQMLDGRDAIWALDADEAASLAVINVLAIVSGELTIQRLKQVVREKLVPSHAKLKNLRNSSFFGYFFWKNTQSFDLDDYVKILDCGYGDVATEQELKDIVSSLGNAKLPHNHLAGWEIYLGPKLMRNDKIQQSILFRVHHTLGDGPALFRALISSLATEDDQPLLAPDPDVIKRLIARLQSRDQKHFFDHVVDAGSSLVKQVFLRSDVNSLHGPKLSGKKQMVWCSSSKLMNAAKSIHTSTGASFSAGLLASFLAAIAKYGQFVDALQACTIALPVRVPSKKVSTVAEMSNQFAMTLVMNKLPGAADDVLSQVRAADQALKNATKPAVLMSNGFIMRLVGELCPRPLAALALYSGQCTAALSNMPGPEQKISLFGAQLDDLIFWVPHRGTTGVGASVLSYAGDLSLALNVDCAVLDGERNAQFLIDTWAEQLIHMAEVLRKSG